MANTKGTAQTETNQAQAGNAFVNLGWPLAITLCGSIIVFATLGHVLVWWVRTRALGSTTALATPDFRDSGSGSVQGGPILYGFHSRSGKKVLVKKNHLRLSAAPSNFTWESTSDFATMGPSPALLGSPMQRNSDSGRVNKAAQWTELEELDSRLHQPVSFIPDLSRTVRT